MDVDLNRLHDNGYEEEQSVGERACLVLGIRAVGVDVVARNKGRAPAEIGGAQSHLPE